VGLQFADADALSGARRWRSLSDVVSHVTTLRPSNGAVNVATLAKSARPPAPRRCRRPGRAPRFRA
jgi:hypothetical protein